MKDQIITNPQKSYSKECLNSFLLTLFLPSHFLDPLAPEALQRGGQSIVFVQCAHIITSPNTFPVHQDIGDSATAGILSQNGLQSLPQWMVVEFDHIRCRDNGVFVK